MEYKISEEKIVYGVLSNSNSIVRRFLHVCENLTTAVRLSKGKVENIREIKGYKIDDEWYYPCDLVRESFEDYCENKSYDGCRYVFDVDMIIDKSTGEILNKG